MGKASRDKGKRGELHLRDLLRRVWPRARRYAAQFGGAAEPDVVGTPFWAEAKTGSIKGIASLWSALRQAERDRVAAGTPDRPILLYMRLDHTTPLVAMPAEDWIQLAAAAALSGYYADNSRR